MSDKIINLDDERDRRSVKQMEEGYANVVAECRECGKLLKVQGCMQDDGVMIMSTGSPIFGSCASKREFPGCRDKMADRAYLVETTAGGRFSVIGLDPDRAFYDQR
jgi:hypothetical protein